MNDNKVSSVSHPLDHGVVTRHQIFFFFWKSTFASLFCINWKPTFVLNEQKLLQTLRGSSKNRAFLFRGYCWHHSVLPSSASSEIFDGWWGIIVLFYLLLFRAPWNLFSQLNSRFVARAEVMSSDTWRTTSSLEKSILSYVSRIQDFTHENGDHIQVTNRWPTSASGFSLFWGHRGTLLSSFSTVGGIRGPVHKFERL